MRGQKDEKPLLGIISMTQERRRKVKKGPRPKYRAQIISHYIKGTIQKPRGYIFEIFDPLLSSWKLLLNRTYVAFSKVMNYCPRGHVVFGKGGMMHFLSLMYFMHFLQIWNPAPYPMPI